MTINADEPQASGDGASVNDPTSRAARRGAELGGTLRPRRLPTPAVSGWAPPARASAPEAAPQPAPQPAPPSARAVPIVTTSAASAASPEQQRYYLCCEVPGGDFIEVIVAVTDGARRRYFTTSDGARLVEVDEDYFVHRSLGDARSLLELDAREMAELEAELGFVRTVRGRDPLVEVEVEGAAEPEPERTVEVERAAEPEPERTVELERAAEPAQPTESTDRTDVNEETERMVTGTNAFEQPDVVASVTPIWAVAPQPDADAVVAAAAQVALAKGIAFVAHRGQVDKVGAAYIDHPGRVAERFDPIAEPVATAAAWLHDVIEDTGLTAQELLEAGVLPEVVEVVTLLTRTPEVPEPEYYGRIRRHAIARSVKIADVDDNSAAWRVRKLDFETQQRLADKYRHAREMLGV